MTQGARTHRKGQVLEPRIASPERPLTPYEEELRKAIWQKAEESGRRTVEASRKKIKSEMDAALQAAEKRG